MQIVSIDQNSTFRFGMEPYEYWNQWRIFTQNQAEIDGSLYEDGDLPLVVLTSGTDFVVTYSSTVVADDSTVDVLYSAEGTSWQNTYDLTAYVIKGGKYFADSYWLVPGPKGVPADGRFILKSSDGENWSQIRIMASNVAGSKLLYNIEYNPSSGTVLVVGKNALYRCNIADIETRESWGKISTTIDGTDQEVFGRVRAAVVDPNTDEWWIASDDGNIFFSANDAQDWTLIDPTFAKWFSSGILSEAASLAIDSTYLYWNSNNERRSSILLRNDLSDRTESTTIFYQNDMNKEFVFQASFDDFVKFKKFEDSSLDFIPAFSQPLVFPSSAEADEYPIVFNIRDLSGDWIFVNYETVLIRTASSLADEGDIIDANGAQNVGLFQTVFGGGDESVVGFAVIETNYNVS